MINEWKYTEWMCGEYDLSIHEMKELLEYFGESGEEEKCRNLRTGIAELKLNTENK